MKAAGQRLAVRFLSGRLEGGVVPLRRGHPLLVGRQPGADLVLTEELASRRHARITYDGKEVVVEDLGSTNGTFVNGDRVERARIAQGDRVLVGETVFTVVAPEAQTDSADTQLRALAHGARGEPPPLSAIQGRLEEVPLLDVLQLVATSRKTGVLAIRSSAGEAAVEIERGEVVACSIRGRASMPPEKALFRIFQWTSGHFDLDPRAARVTPPPPLAGSVDTLVLEAARQIDELRRLRATLPRRLAFADVVPIVALDPVDRPLVDLVVAVGDREAVLDATPLPDLAAAERLAALHARGVLVGVPDEPGAEVA